eukprot:m51a1_g2168 hypothetical protein (360) ;mRNA; r:54410-55863
MGGGVLRLLGSQCFRVRLVCATLSGKSVKIEDIRSSDAAPGLKDYEVSFLRMLEKMTSGCNIDINTRGTGVYYKPGTITGGTFAHDCGSERGVAYFLEALAVLAPFAKEPVVATLTGVTNEAADQSVDLVRSVMLPNLMRLGIEEGLDLKIAKRGAPPLGGGEVVFRCPIVRSLRPLQLVDEGLVRRIRGVAYCTKMSPQMANRMVDGARGIVNKFARDVYVFTDHKKGPDGGLSPGFALALVAETTTGCLLSAEAVATPGDIPEEVGRKAAKALLQEIKNGGCVDSANQWSVLLFALLSTEDVSKIRVGKLTPFTIACLRTYKEMFGVTFNIQPDSESRTVTLSCTGIGFINHAKRVF